MNMYQSKKAFTLVELIVVIVILAILATIAFLSFSSQSGSARDSVRLSDTTNIRKWLELRQAIGWSIPLPANPKAYTWWATATGVSWVMISEWTVNNSILSTLSAGIKDPSWSEYRYSIISQWWQPLYYQLALELENPTSMRENISNPFIAFNEDIASADTAVSKIVQLKWNYMFDPSLPSLFILSGSTSSLSGWIYNPDVCFVLDWSATNNFSSKDNCVAKKDMNLKEYDKSLVGYWDMETTFNSWWVTYLKDLSGNGNDGIGSGGMVYATSITWWLIGKSLNFSWWFISLWDKQSTRITDSITMVALININIWTTQTNNLSILWKYGIANPNDLWYNMNINHNYGSNYWTISCGWLWCGWASPQSLNDGTYYMIAMSSDWIIWKAFINWNLVAQNSAQATRYKVSSWSTTELRIWSVVRGWTNFNWIIDEARIYNRTLSDGEIRQQAKSVWF